MAKKVTATILFLDIMNSLEIGNYSHMRNLKRFESKQEVQLKEFHRFGPEESGPHRLW
jgi:hypothetical protein